MNATFLTAWSDTLLVEPGNNTPKKSGETDPLKKNQRCVGQAVKIWAKLRCYWADRRMRMHGFAKGWQG